MKGGYDIYESTGRAGTNRKNRANPFLNPATAKIDDRTRDDFMLLANKIADGILFIDPNTSDNTYTWRDFFSPHNFSDQSCEPHYALFLAFLELFQVSIENLNTLTKRHLDFFYKEVLKFRKKPALADNVHVILSLAKNVKEHILLKGTRFSAGEDEFGRSVYYQLEKDTSFNQIALEAVKQLCIPFDRVELDQGIPYNALGAFTSTITEQGEETLNEMEPWYPFRSEEMDRAEFGWAIASPQLLLNDGDRKITFRILCDFLGDQNTREHFYRSFKGLSINATQIDLTNCFDLAFSTKNGWEEVSAYSVVLSDPGRINGIENKEVSIEISCDISFSASSITAFPKDLDGIPIYSRWPIVKTSLSTEEKPFPYIFLRSLKIKTIDLNVSVKGFKKLNLSNDQLPIDPNNVYAPFGSLPTKGSNFFIGSREIFQKSLEQLVIELDWHNPLDKYADQIRASISMLSEGEWILLTKNSDINLFSDDLSKTTRITLDIDDVKATIANQDLRRGRKFNLTDDTFNLSSRDGFLRLTLTNYPDIDLANPENLPPYTPQLATIRLGYESCHSLAIGETVDEVLHIHPFGWDLNPYTIHQSFLLPQYHYEGTLFFGLREVESWQELSILFQLVEGTSDPEVDIPGIKWSYRHDNQWVAFEEVDILEDTIHSFNRSGIVSFRLPETNNSDDRLFDPELYWICAEIVGDISGICQIISIRTQAARLVFFGDEEVLGQHTLPLESACISEMVTIDNAVDAVIQPYPSFNGRRKETDEDFYVRVSEHLRHKGRAITVWDYEHMVLEEFPSLYEAKCFQHYNPKVGYAPGSILMLVVADLKKQTSRSLFKPTVSLNRLDHIKRYLEEVSPPMVDVTVKNPVFEEIQVSFLVKFKSEVNPGYYERKLNKALQRFLSPWAFEEDMDISFGNTIYKSSLLHFVEQQPYVDVVAFFEMNHADAEGNLRINIEEAKASKPVSLLVSASNHEIKVIQDKAIICGEGIDFMIVGKTFKIMDVFKPDRVIEDGVGYMKMEKTFKII